MVNARTFVVGASVIVAAFAAISGYYLSLPQLAEGLENPFLTRAFAGFFLFVGDLGIWLTRLGIGTASENQSFLMDTSMLIFGGRKNEVVTTTNAVFDGVPVVIYKPENYSPGGVSMMYFHGGGFVILSPAGYDHITRKFSGMIQGLVISVDYRKAPKHVFPAALDDCVKATAYFLKNAARYGADPNKVVVAGDSAGGNLAATVSLDLRGRKDLPKLKAQIVIYPCVQAVDFNLPSYQQTSFILDRAIMAYFWLNYAVGDYNDAAAAMENDHTSSVFKQSKLARFVDPTRLDQKRIKSNYKPMRKDFGNATMWERYEKIMTNPRYSPLMAKDLSNLPPAFIVIAEHDPLRDEGLLYAQRLEAAKVKVITKVYERGFHGMLVFNNKPFDIPSGVKCVNDIVEYIRQIE